MNRMYVIVILLILSACQQDQVSYADFVSKVNNLESGLKKEQTFGGLVIEVFYQTPEMVAINEATSEEEYRDIIKEKNQFHHFKLRFRTNESGVEFLKYNISRTSDHNFRLQYLISEISKDIYLISGNDTLPCSLHHFERTYKLTNYGDVTLLFERKSLHDHKTDVSNDIRFIYDDKMYGIGQLSFVFRSEDINDAPKLSFSK